MTEKSKAQNLISEEIFKFRKAKILKKIRHNVKDDLKT
jgi:hypothetical protein